MQSTITLHGVSFGKNPRDGQRRVFDEAAKKTNKTLNVKLPTGYGKTLTALGCYAIRQKNFGANRLLYVTPTDAQHLQFCNDAPGSMAIAGVAGNLKVCDVRFFGVNAIKKSLNNECQVFAITIQSMASDINLIRKLMEKGDWVVVWDEYHHYGEGLAWGNIVQDIRSLSPDFTLAMSATPNRPNDDSVFGEPDVAVLYRDAVGEKSVKHMLGHSYVYRIDAVNSDGDVVTMTTDELAKEAGSESPDKIEKMRIERKMRWSPKYVSPLISLPIERMIRTRLTTGEKVQAIVGAMCVSHAQLVCEQMQAMFPELKVDWVGTGTYGRKPEENRQILEMFCPPKDPHTDTRSTPSLDVLVHVGMAGEGLDSSLVSEIIHLNKASVNNSNNQENGRGARIIYDINGRPVDIAANINFDSSSGYAKGGYIGQSIMDAMDMLPPSQEEEEREILTRDVDPFNTEIPEEPVVKIMDMELQRIDSGSPEVKRFIEAIESHVTGIDYRVVQTDASEMAKVINLYRAMRKVEANEFNERSVISQIDDQVEGALSAVASKVLRLKVSSGQRVEKSAIGDIKRRVNSRKKHVCGEKDNRDKDSLLRHYRWLQNLDSELNQKREIPTWLL